MATPFSEGKSSAGRIGFKVKMQCLSLAVLSLGHPWPLRQKCLTDIWGGVGGEC